MSLALVAALSASPVARDHPPTPRVIGLVELPGIFLQNEDRDSNVPARPRPVRVRTRPDPAAPPVATIAGSDDIEGREHGYESQSAVVYDRRGDWFLVRAKGRMGWVGPRDAGRFRSYVELVKEGMTYLTGDWDRRLRAAPNGDVTLRLPPTGTETSLPDFGQPGRSPSDVDVLDVRGSGDRMWFRVRVTSGRCREPVEKGLGEGWVPGYTAAGRPMLWYYSRGC